MSSAWISLDFLVDFAARTKHFFALKVQLAAHLLHALLQALEVGAKFRSAVLLLLDFKLRALKLQHQRVDLREKSSL